MGKVASMMWRPFRDFNVEARAMKVISQDKPLPAPKYKIDQHDYERLLKEYPTAYQEALKKDPNLDQRLKDVFVTSEDPTLQAPQSSSSASRKLPLNRKIVDEPEFGFREPSKVPYGRVTLRTALTFINKHQSNPSEYPVSQIVEEHKLAEETVENILQYYRVCEIYIPNERKVKANFIGPLIKRTQIITHKIKELPTEDKKPD